MNGCVVPSLYSPCSRSPFGVVSAATLTGRVLTPDGTPASHVRVSLTRPDVPSFANFARTAADGSYRFTGLSAGSYTITAESREQAWFAAPLRALSLVEGKETVAPDLRTCLGASLKISVVDAVTGAPIPAVAVTLYHGNTISNELPASRLRTDGNGQCLYRTLPEQMTLLCTEPQLGYLQMMDTEAVLVELQDGKVATAVLKLHKGLSVTGTVTDREGRPVAGATFSLWMPYAQGGGRNPNDTQMQFTTDQLGHFQLAGLPAGRGVLRLVVADEQSCEWVHPMWQNIAVPAKDPIKVTLTRITRDTVRGRVVDMQQQPLAGVTATFGVEYKTPTAGIQQKLTVVTGADGGYELTKVPAGQQVSLISLEKAGYCQLLTGLLRTNGKSGMDDAVMAACTATVHGQVCDAAGKPVHGASVVSVEVGRSTRAVTDEAGSFTLEHQPECELHLVAATPTGGGLATCAAHATDVRITCTPGLVAKPRDIGLAQSLLEADDKLPKAQRRFNRADTLRAMADVDLELAVKLATTGDEPMPEGLRAYLLARQAEQDPAQVGEILVQLNILRNPDCKLYAAVEMGIAVAQADPGLAEQLYLIARPLYDRSAHGDNWSTIEGLGTFSDISVRIIALAGLLQKTAELDAMLAHLSELAKRAGGMIIDPLFAAAGRVSPEFVLMVYNKIDHRAANAALGQAVASMARRDPTAALRLLKMIDANKYDNGGLPTILSLIDVLGKKDPAAALALANAQPDNMRSAALLEAAAFQPKAAACTLLQEVFSAENNRTIENIARACTIDPALAKTLYTNNRQDLEARGCTYYMGLTMHYSYSAEYAYRISGIDPVEARLMLETEYAHALLTVQPDERIFLQGFALAMCTLDVDRALAMHDTIIKLPGPNFGPPLSQRLMHYILMSREERVGVPNLFL